MSIPEESDARSEEKEERKKAKTRPRRVDANARRELEGLRQDRRAFLRKSAAGAGLVALGATLGYGSGLAQATGLSGNTRTVITDSEIAARVIGGVRIATEFIPDPVPAGTDTDPYPGSAIQAALDDGLAVYIPYGTWKLSAPISRPVDNATILGAGKSTRLLFDGITPCISAGIQTGWLVANLAVDGGGINIATSSQSRISEIWVNGLLTDNRPIGIGGGGSGGYYGVRAEDYITSGDGSPLNPYNADAIQNAINSLPGRGGTVFIKSGIWRGASRISVTGSSRKVVLQGEGTEYSIYNKDGSGNAHSGTQIEAGFDVYVPTDFYDLHITPHPINFKLQPCVKVIVDPTQAIPINRWVGGFTISRCRFSEGDPAMWWTGQNLGAAVWQIWMARVSQCVFFNSKRCLKVDHGDSTNIDKGRLWNVMFEQLKFQHNSSGGRTIDISGIDHWKGSMENILVEDCASAADDYAVYISVYGSGGLFICNIDPGDGTNAQNDYYFNLGREATVMNIRHEKGVDIGGRGRYIGIGRSSSGTGSVNIIGGTELTIEANSGVTFSLGTVDGTTDRAKVRIKKQPGGQAQFIGTTTPGSSPFTYTNLDMYDEMVYVVGGSVTDITRGGQSIGTDRSHFLSPGDSITIAFTSVPSIKRYGVS